MKKLILILSILLFQSQAYALEDCIIISDNIVKSVKSSDENIAYVKPFYSIDNQKNIILVKAKNTGKAFLTIETKDEETVIEINIKDNETLIQQKEGFSSYILDIPSSKPILRSE